MFVVSIATALCLLLSTVSASNYDAYISELAKRNQRLHEDHLNQFPDVRVALDDFYSKRLNAIQAAHDYDPEDSDDYEPDAYWTKVVSAMNNVRRFKNPEIPSQNNLWGEHKVTGGTGKGSQVLGGGELSKLEIKTDKLPAYCDPPNPCPVGMDPESAPSPCDKNIPDTKVFNKNWILTKMRNDECPCDTEHMQGCSKSFRTMNQRSMPMGSAEDNPYFSGHKRDQVVAKKAPAMLSDPRKNPIEEEEENPFLQGQALRSVKKKDGRNLGPYM